jgi:hypothetical protein
MMLWGKSFLLSLGLNLPTCEMDIVITSLWTSLKERM